MLSAIVLYQNKEKKLKDCLNSLKFCDEIILILDTDNKFQKSDSKLPINNKNTKYKYYNRKLIRDFASQRNFGDSMAQGDWILHIDADEIITNKLKKEIIYLLKNKSQKTRHKHNISAYYIKRRDNFWTRELKYGEVRTAYSKGIIRLYQKNSGIWQGKIHERFITDYKVGKLTNYLDHYPHQTLKEFILLVNMYSTIRANELYNANIKTNIFQIIFFPFFKFIYTYFIKLGFLDQAPGFVYSFMMSFHSFLTRAKLYQKQNKK